jgi:hypothetical protein
MFDFGFQNFNSSLLMSGILNCKNRFSKGFA